MDKETLGDQLTEAIFALVRSHVDGTAFRIKPEGAMATFGLQLALVFNERPDLAKLLVEMIPTHMPDLLVAFMKADIQELLTLPRVGEEEENDG